MAEPVVRVVGLRETISALRQVNAELPKELRAAGVEAGQPVAAAARAEAPVLTGRTQGTVRVVASQRGAAVRAGGARAPYVGAVHFGWPAHNIKPNLWLFRAATRRVTTAVAVYQRRVASLIRRAGF